MRITLACLPVALATLGTACTGSTSAVQNDLISHRASFEETAPATYSFTWQQSCFCPEEMTKPIRVSVNGSTITKAVYVEDQQPVDTYVRNSLKTIDGVFDLIQDRLDRRADEIAVTYDGAAHYPASVFIDIDKRASDEEISLHLSDFTQGQ